MIQKFTLTIALAISFALCIMPMASATENAHQTVSPNTNTDQYLKNGITGDKVTEIQKWLKNQNLYNGKVDSWFGPITEDAVKEFQMQAGIKVDGIIGPQTLRAMEKWGSKTNNSVKKDNSKTTSSQSIKASYGGKKSQNYAKKSYSGRYYSSGSGWGYINGMDCWAMSDSLASKYSSQGYQTRILHAQTSLSSDHRWVEVNDGNGWHAAPDYGSLPKIYTPTY